MPKVPYECLYPRVSKRTRDNMFDAIDMFVDDVEKLRRTKKLSTTDLRAIDVLERQAKLMREVLNEWEANLGIKCKEFE